MKIRISEILIQDRTRQDYGNLQELADNILLNGLLQPVGVNEVMIASTEVKGIYSRYNLVFGERRLRACKLLGWELIDAVEVAPNTITEGEYAENVHRKDFSPSEKVAIANRIKEEVLGNRQGQRTDIEPGLKIAAVVPGEKSATTAAKLAGLGNKDTYRQAQMVIDHGCPELVQAMDQGRVSISNAAMISKLPKEQQEEALKQEKPKPPVISQEPVEISPLVMKGLVLFAERIVANNREYLQKNNSFVIPVTDHELGRILVQVTRR